MISDEVSYCILLLTEHKVRYNILILCFKHGPQVRVYFLIYSQGRDQIAIHVN